MRGVPEDYRDHHPGPADVSCVIEVAEASLSYDRTKQRVYGEAGIPQYLLVNIPERQIEVYEQPSPHDGRYLKRVVVMSAQQIRVALGMERYLDVSANDLLP